MHAPEINPERQALLSKLENELAATTRLSRAEARHAIQALELLTRPNAPPYLESESMELLLTLPPPTLEKMIAEIFNDASTHPEVNRNL